MLLSRVARHDPGLSPAGARARGCGPLLAPGSSHACTSLGRCPGSSDRPWRSKAGPTSRSFLLCGLSMVLCCDVLNRGILKEGRLEGHSPGLPPRTRMCWFCCPSGPPGSQKRVQAPAAPCGSTRPPQATSPRRRPRLGPGLRSPTPQPVATALCASPLLLLSVSLVGTLGAQTRGPQEPPNLRSSCSTSSVLFPRRTGCSVASPLLLLSVSLVGTLGAQTRGPQEPPNLRSSCSTSSVLFPRRTGCSVLSLFSRASP